MTWALFLFIHFQISAQTICEPLLDNCDYYLCREELSNCQHRSYFEVFGYKYCRKFTDDIKPKMSLQGQNWVDDVRLCLQQELELIDEKVGQRMRKGEISCEAMEEKAIQSHEVCYISTGYCELSSTDRAMVNRTALPEVWRPRYLAQAMKLIRLCDERWNPEKYLTTCRKKGLRKRDRYGNLDSRPVCQDGETPTDIDKI